MLRIIEKFGTDDNGDGTYEICAERDGKHLLGFYAHSLYECPEDASLGRDLGYAYAAVEFFRLGLEAAKAGEEVVFERVEEE